MSDHVALLGRVACLVNGGSRPEHAVAEVLDELRASLGLRAARLVVDDPRAGVAVHAGGVQEPWPDGEPVLRIPLEHDTARFGFLEIMPELSGDAAEAVRAAGQILGLYLGALTRSRDLAGELASQAREIEGQRRFTSLIIDSLPVGLYVIDRDYRIQVWNRKRETGTQGLRRDMVVGRPIFDVLTRQSPEQLRGEFDRVFDTGEIQQAEQEVAVGAETRTYRITKIPMRLGGDAITHVITIGEDVSDWRTIQDRILQSEKLAAIGQLAAGVMHEINNPLATIGACAAAIDGRLDDKDVAVEAVREYVRIVEKEVDRCTNIVDGLLDFSRPKGRAKGAVAMHAVVDDVLFLLRHHKRFKELVVARDLASDLPPAHANAEQIVQVLMALSLNAVDAMEGGGRLTLRTRRSRFRDEVVVEVEDTGIGIARADQHKIFEPFFTTKAPGRGTGLGLSICYGIVEEHRGRIEVESHPGRGSTFRVFLPVAQT